MQYNRKFYDKHGLKITDEPVVNHTDKYLANSSERLHNAVKKATIPLSIVAELEQLVARYPDVPSLKNYLYIAYVRTDQRGKSVEMLNKTIQQHPNYIFAYANLANLYIEEKNYNKAADALKEPYDIRKFEQEEFIHVSAFKNYYSTAIRVELIRENMAEAERMHRLLFDYDPKDKDLAQTALIIQASKFKSGIGRQAKNKRQVVVISKVIKGNYLSDEQGKPVFYHPEIHQLYQYSLDNIPKKVIEQILALPRQTLISDLEHVFMDTVIRQSHFREDDWQEDNYNFFLHALYMLTELRAYESLPVILDFLGQDKEFLDYWVADWLETYFHPTLYLLAQNQLEVLKNFALEENIYSWSRVLVCEIVGQVAMKQPERRAEVVAWFRHIIRYHLDNAQNDNLIDTDFLSSVIGDITHFNAVELEEDIKELYQTGWINDTFYGDLTEILKSVHDTFDPHYDNPIPLDIYELYSGEFTKRQNKSNRPIDPELIKTINDPYHNYMVSLLTKTFSKMGDKNLDIDSDDDEYLDDDDEDEDYYWTPPQPTIKRAEPKVGRNDPCPCGSGKKYKKCHGA